MFNKGKKLRYQWLHYSENHNPKPKIWAAAAAAAAG